MEGLLDKAVTIATFVVVGMAVRHPFTWHTELRRLEIQIMKESRGSWGCPSIWGPKGCTTYAPVDIGTGLPRVKS